MSDNVFLFPASATLTPTMALESAMRLVEAGELETVLIVGYDAEGKLVIRSSRMDRKDALWLIKRAEHHALFAE